MVDLKQLFEEGKFQEILDVEKDIRSPGDLFLLASACLSLGNGEKALEVLLAHRDVLWNENPLLTMKATLETRAILGQFEEAYADLNVFQNKPYVSQQVEEALRAYPKWLRQKEFEGYRKESTSEDFYAKLKKAEGNDLKLLEALLCLRKIEDIKAAVPTLHSLLGELHHDDIINTVLLLLIAVKDESELRVTKDGKEYVLIPAKTPFPYAASGYEEVRKAISDRGEAPSLQETAATLLDNYLMIIFPELPLSKDNALTYGAASLALARKYYGIEEGQLSDEARTLRDEMDALLALHPPLMNSF